MKIKFKLGKFDLEFDLIAIAGFVLLLLTDSYQLD